ncbi:MAG: acyl-CoA reductase [Gemmatimonadota bacterium]
MIRSAEAAAARCRSLVQAGSALAVRPLDEVLRALGAACARWANPLDPDRQAGEAALAAHWGVDRAAMATVLDAAFPQWTTTALRGWIAGELGDPAVLEGFAPSGGGRRWANAPRLVVALAARGVPTTPVGDLLAALVLRSPIWLKPAAGADDLASRFAATLAAIDPGLGAAVETDPFGVGTPAESIALGAADVIVATGRAETITALQSTLAAAGRGAAGDARLIVHGPRLSVALVTRDALASDHDGVIERLADDVAFAGQMGCLSPVVTYVEGDGPSLDVLAEPLWTACCARWPVSGRAAGTPAERTAWAAWAAVAAVDGVAGRAGKSWGGADSGWTVEVREREEAPDAPPIPRVVRLIPLTDAADAARLCAERRGLISSVGIEASAERAAELVAGLAHAGVERLAPLGQLQRPPLAWRRDGRATLAELVRWVDWEAASPPAIPPA